MPELIFDEAAHIYTVDGVKVPSVTGICAPLTAGKYPPAGVVQAAAARGRRIHELCMLYDFGALPDEIERGLLGYLKAWATFCRDYPFVWHQVELPVYCAEHEYAGTLDREGALDGRFLVVDIKSAASLDRPAKVALACQLAAYAEARRGCGSPVGSPGLGVQLKSDGSYTLHWQEKIEQRYGFEALPLFHQLRQHHKIVKGY